MVLKVSELLYKWRIEEARKRLESKLENEVYVTDLVYCPLKYRYSKLYSEIALAASFSPVTVVGELVHMGLEKFLVDTLGSDAVKTEVEYERDIVVEGTTYIVRGRVDAVVEDTVIEIKTSRSDTNIPYQHHIQQVRLYLWLTGLPRGLIVYLTPERVAEFSIETPASDGEVADLVRSIISGEPAPRYPWECSYCPYSALCARKAR